MALFIGFGCYFLFVVLDCQFYVRFENVAVESDKEYNILQLPTIKGTFNITFAVTEHLNYGYAKIKVTYNGTDYTIEEITNYVSGSLGSIAFKVSNGYLQSSSWVPSTLSYVTASINIDNINYIV